MKLCFLFETSLKHYGPFPIDPGLKSLLTVLNNIGCHTTDSCSGLAQDHPSGISPNLPSKRSTKDLYIEFLTETLTSEIVRIFRKHGFSVRKTRKNKSVARIKKIFPDEEIMSIFNSIIRDLRALS